MQPILSRILTDASVRKDMDTKKVIMQSSEALLPWKD